MGHFITLEGGEGCGKSTQAKLLAKALEKAGHRVVLTREPGGTPAAEALREIVLTDSVLLLPKTETLLFLAARLEHWKGLIQPELEQGAIVICDRFSDSTLAYQGIARGLGVEQIRKWSDIIVGEAVPNLTLWLDMPVQQGLARAITRALKLNDGNRFESLEEYAFHELVREGFAELAKAEPERIARVDAAPDVETVHRAICEVVRERLRLAF